MKQSFFTLKHVKPLFTTSLLALLATPAWASLSSQPATPNQVRIVASAATPAQIQAKVGQNGQKSALKSSPLENQASGAASKVNRIYRKWAGTRYRLGGTGHGGIDCSAFVQKTMSGAFNIDLPRSTAEQRHSGRAISKSDLRPGDLVFFRKNNHVGVYIGGGKFVHASSSKGVTTSSLSESYWARNYTQSRRVM